MSDKKDLSIQQLISLYHSHVQSGDDNTAQNILTYAFQVPSYRGEALICKGLNALEKEDLSSAFLYFASAVVLLPKRTDVIALVVHVMQLRGCNNLASYWLNAISKNYPSDSVLRDTFYKIELSRESVKENWEKILLPRIPEIDAPHELRVVFDFIRSLHGCSTYIGFVRFLPKERKINGWVINVRKPNEPTTITIEIGKQKQFFLADSMHPLLSQAGITHSVGLINLQVPESSQILSFKISVDGQELLGSPLAVFPYFDPFLVNKIDLNSVGKKNKEPVDVLIPVYLGREETLSCVESVLRFKKDNKTPHRVIVLDDASPDVILGNDLARLARSGKIIHIKQPANLGFIRNMNRGMLLHPRSDVVWLNADTQVHGNWLDRLQKSAYSADDIASVTPFTNNGELMSFPISRASHPMPSSTELAELDTLASELDIAPIQLETGCGFCLYIKRTVLNQIGYLDELELKRGYGEETDWCLRASKYGWRHVGSVNTFVSHQGGISFGSEKALRVAYNNNLLRKRYPKADSDYKRFSALDPLRGARDALQRARLYNGSFEKAELLIITRESVGSSYEASIKLTYKNCAEFSEVSLRVLSEKLPIVLNYKLPSDKSLLLKDLAFLKLSEVVLDFYGNMPQFLFDLPSILNCSYAINTYSDLILDENFIFNKPPVWIRVPHAVVLDAYKKKFPGILISVNEFSLDASVTNLYGSEISSFLIADDLSDPTLLSAWKQFILKMKKDERAKLIHALLPESGPAEVSLIQMGVMVLPALENLEQLDCLSLLNCGVAISLDLMPTSAWPAIQLASSLQLPLFAPSGTIAQQIGALPLEKLPFLDSSFVADIYR